MLLSHSDVVPADAKYWKYPPFSGKIVEGQIWGRGALDMKGMGLVELMAMVAAKRANLPLERDVVLLVVADEEEGADYGIKWMFSQRPDLMKNIAGVVNEEGPGHLEKGKLTFWEVRPGQKGLVWLKLVAKGTPGHGSLPYANSAPNRLIRALYRIQGWETPIQVLPEAKRFFAQLARNETGKRAEQLKDVENGLKDPEFKAWLTSVRHYNAMIRNTISITQLEGSNKTNVIPPVATAMIDCRLLPSEHVDHFIHELKKVINDPEIEIVNTDVYEPVPASTVDTDLFRSICGVIEKYYPGALVVTPYSRAANDSRYFQMRNIIAYGFFPFAVPEEELATMHGNDERISTANVKKGVEMLYDLIVDFAGKK